MLLARQELDQPTGVLNKTGLQRGIDALLRPERREAFTLCMADLDGFKCVNDQYGHLAGDTVLKNFCKIARRNIRAGDLLGRYGGDEFLFVFRTEINRAVKILLSGVSPGPVTFSAGAVLCAQDDARDRLGLIREADALLYRAKAAGGGLTVAEDEALPPREEQRHLSR